MASVAKIDRKPRKSGVRPAINIPEQYKINSRKPPGPKTLAEKRIFNNFYHLTYGPTQSYQVEKKIEPSNADKQGTAIESKVPSEYVRIKRDDLKRIVNKLKKCYAKFQKLKALSKRYLCGVLFKAMRF